MRVAVISDIHGNAHALEAVLDELAVEAPDEVWCLGDVVGYGPRPNRCCALVSERAEPCLSGNHDLAVLGRISLRQFAGDAAASARWTQEVLTDASRSFLEGLSSRATVEGADVELYHASPRDAVWEYVLTDEAVEAAFELTEAGLVLVGHSHVPLAVTVDEAGTRGGLAPGGTEVELGGGRWLLNPGSVGQPRDGDPRAAYLLLELTQRVAFFRRVVYPIEATQRELRERGLPEALAARLEQGV